MSRASPGYFKPPDFLPHSPPSIPGAPDLPSLGPNYLTYHPPKPTPVHDSHPPSHPTPPVLPKNVKWPSYVRRSRHSVPLSGTSGGETTDITQSPPRTSIGTSRSETSLTLPALHFGSIDWRLRLLAGLPFLIRDDVLCMVHFSAPLLRQVLIEEQELTRTSIVPITSPFVGVGTTTKDIKSRWLARPVTSLPRPHTSRQINKTSSMLRCNQMIPTAKTQLQLFTMVNLSVMAISQ